MRGVPDLLLEHQLLGVTTNERGSPPAERVRVHDLTRDNEDFALLEQLHDDLVGVLVASSPSESTRKAQRVGTETHLDILTLKIGHLAREHAALVDGARRHLLFLDEALRDSDAVVIFSERGRLVDDTRARVGRNVLVRDDFEAAVSELRSRTVR